MTLSWSEMDDLASALEGAFPQTDLSVLSHDELKEMVSSVKGYEETTFSDDFDLEALINVWIAIQFPEEPEMVPSSEIE